jgi:hypothetical protein
MRQSDPTVQWLLKGDPAIRWQALRDLTGASKRVVEREQRSVTETGWGARLLKLQEPDGQWGGGIYTPKWTSTTYTTILLRQLGLPPKHAQALKACALLFDRGFYRDGGFNCWSQYNHSETCVTGMILAVAAYFRFSDHRVHGLAEYLLKQQMRDGGWNCRSYDGATHSSFHTTILVLEGLLEYERFGPHRAGQTRQAARRGREFLLAHRLFRSHRTGKVVNSAMTRFSFPPRWHYDILRALDHFQQAGAARDERLREAIEIVRQRRKQDGRWVLQNRYPGRVFFDMEKLGAPSRWNTLRALRVLRWWERE